MKTKICSLFILILISVTAHAEKTEIFGVFSSFHESPTSGDLVGEEIHVLPHPAIVVQGSEGRAGEPELFNVRIIGNNILFKIPEGSMTGLPPGHYEATITKSKMILVGPKYKREIPRRKSYWR